MSIPASYAEFYAPIEDAIEKYGDTITLHALYADLEKQFSLTQEELTRGASDGTNWFEGRVRYALNYLKAQGRVVNISRGVWGLKK